MKSIKFRAWNNMFKKMDFGGGDLLLRINSDDFTEPMQYTGLEDKNGIEIYEGDILSGYKCHYPVEYNAGSFMWNDEFLGHTIEVDTDGLELYYLVESDGCDTLEVIGNIYENSDLLK